ncbi:hypothetical protein GCM10019059_11090 [Camelimonas fluminis]|uniref:DUF3100 domain-containing protein n=1 Tax=Camelimonas fluminis TaxID=1576911 RepID=A0ABV7UL21_9HYPH|nr:DUF3100 domain-containing protein [Camelimonas fluminis]GHE53743.1 hypothetical protein GCM10019059_11090 [Camelimonas fluminis]
MTTTPVTAAPADVPAERDFFSKGKIFIAVLIVVALAETIGVVKFKLGPGVVLLQPMVWALLLAAAWGVAWRYLPAPLRIGTSLQGYAGQLLNAGLLLFIVKMAFTVGGALPAVRQAGWALLFQELGHSFGTLVLGLPLALLLGVKREAVGATFSIGREGNLVIIGDKYGMASPEGRGVLAEYITGTVLGALFIALLAGFITSLNIFDPRSLAMGAGVGSGSMMAAAIGAISAQYPATMTKELHAIASAANLMTAVMGFYVALFVTLPVCSWLYDRLEPVLGRFSKFQSDKVGPTVSAADVDLKPAPFGLQDRILAWLVVAGGVLIGNTITYKVPVGASLIGLAIVLVVIFLVELVARLLPKVPHIILMVVLTTPLGIPGVLPFSHILVENTEKLNFMAFTTPVLALAGYSVAKDLPIFRQLSWRIVVVSLTAAAGTFLGATVVAEFFH